MAGRGQGCGRGGSTAGLISAGVGSGEGRGAYGVGLVRHLLSFNGCSVRGEKTVPDMHRQMGHADVGSDI